MQQHGESITAKEASDKLASEAAVKKLSEIATDAKSREGELLKTAQVRVRVRVRARVRVRVRVRVGLILTLT